MFDALCMCMLASFALYGLVWIYWKFTINRYKHFKSDPTDPLFGNVLRYPLDPHGAMMAGRGLWRKFGSKFIIWVGPKPMLFCSDAKWVETLLKSQELIVKSDFYSFLYDWLGNGLLMSSGTKWKSRRKLITPAFHFSILKDFMQIFNEQSTVCISRLKSLSDSKEPFDVQPLICSLTLDIICEAAMGVKIHAQSEAQSDYAKAVTNMSLYFIKRTRRPWFWPNFILHFTQFGKEYKKALDTVHSFTRNVIVSRINERKYLKNTQRAFLDVLLDAYAENEIDLDGIQEEVDTFMFEGHDTTAVSWTLYLLSLHPDVQKKVQEEIDAVWVKDQSLDDKITELKYLECVIKEVLRLYPPVTLYGRKMKRDVSIDGCIVPKGTEFCVYTYGLHMDENYWTNPEEFIPERFMSDRFLRQNSFQYLPFAAGPRNCIGQKFAMLEEKIILFNILHEFSFTTEQQPEQMQLRAQFVLRSINGIWLNSVKRASAN